MEAAGVVHASTPAKDSSLAEHQNNTRQWAAAKCFSCEAADVLTFQICFDSCHREHFWARFHRARANVTIPLLHFQPNKEKQQTKKNKNKKLNC